MSEHFCRKGTRRKRTPVSGYQALVAQPNRESEDDGIVLLCAGRTGEFDQPGPVCGDCQTGHLRWAEAGYVAWHRICDVCGSHWDLHPIWLRFRSGVPEVAPDTALGDSGKTHADLLVLVTPGLMAEAQEPGNIRQYAGVAVPACWARRARFYGG